MPAARLRLALLLAALALGAAFPSAASAGAEERKLRSVLADAMRAAGPRSGAYVRNMSEGGRLFAERAARKRSLASNTKLFTTAAVLDRFGAERALVTQVRGDGRLTSSGDWRGALYLVGGGDPTFGSRSFARRHGSGATPTALADALRRAGIRRVAGRVRGDESRYDSLRGGPASGYRTSSFVGPLSALSFNSGDSRRGFQSNPPRVAARKLTKALEQRGVPVRGAARTGKAPAGAAPLARVRSPATGSLVEGTNKPSNNFFAEMLLKELGAAGPGKGTTDRGARRARKFAARLGARARLVDGSGLAHENRATPRNVVDLLVGLDRRANFAAQFPAFKRSLPIAGVDGTLSGRMRGKAAEGRCQAKTGTLTDVSTLSGYCDSRGGDRLAFSFLMNRIDVGRARDLQDRMVNALARYRG